MFVCSKGPLKPQLQPTHPPSCCNANANRHRFSCQLELHHYQALTSRIGSSSCLFPDWVNNGSSSVLDAFLRLDQYKKQLLSGGLIFNMDLQGSFTAKPVSTAERSAAVISSEEGLTM